MSRTQYVLSREDFIEQGFGSLGYDGIVHAKRQGGIIFRIHSWEEIIYTPLSDETQTQLNTQG